MRIPAPPALLLFVLAVGPAAAGTPPLSLVHDTVVSLEVRLSLVGPDGAIDLVQEKLEVLEGETLDQHRLLEATPPVSVVLELTPRIERARELCLVAIGGRVRDGAGGVEIDTQVAAAPTRLRLVELWRDEARSLRLVLGVAALWKDVPRVTTVLEGARPVELLVEMHAGGRLIERHRLGSMVGDAVTVGAGRRDTATGPAGAEGLAEGAMIEIAPRSLEDGVLDLAVRLVVASGSDESGLLPPSGELAARERVLPGEAVQLPLPSPEGAPPLLVRVVPYF
jgi:hypothetical protein